MLQVFHYADQDFIFHDQDGSMHWCNNLFASCRQWRISIYISLLTVLRNEYMVPVPYKSITISIPTTGFLSSNYTRKTLSHLLPVLFNDFICHGTEGEQWPLMSKRPWPVSWSAAGRAWYTVCNQQVILFRTTRSPNCLLTVSSIIILGLRVKTMV